MTRAFKPGDRVLHRGREGVILGRVAGGDRLRVEFRHTEWVQSFELIHGTMRAKDVDRKDWKSAAANDAD